MKWRYRSTFVLFLGLFLIIFLRLFYWQIVRANELSSLGESQYGSQIRIVPTRGEIKTSDNFPIAANKVSYLVFANPKEIGEVDKTTQLISPILDLDTASVSGLLTLNRFWVPLKSRVETEKKDELEKLK